MAKLTEQDFRKELTSGKLSRLYLLYGEEKYLVKKYTELLVQKAAGKDPSDFDFVRFEAETEPEKIVAACEQLPVFAERKCVLVLDYNAEAASESDLGILEDYLADVSPRTVLVFSMTTLDAPTGQKAGEKKGAKFKRLLTAAEKNGQTVELAKRGDIALEKQLVAWAERSGCRLNRFNAARIISLCGTDMNTLRNETDKLCAFANGEEITEEMIRLLVVKNTEVRVYALADCLRKNDFDGAYRQLFALFDQNEKPEIILSVLSSAFVDMYRMRVASESGKTTAEVAADFKYGRRDFLLKNALSQSRQYSTKTLRRILDVILKTDLRLKSSPADNRIQLETLLAEILLAVKEGQT